MGSRLPARHLALTARTCLCPSAPAQTRPFAPTGLALPSCHRQKWSWGNLNPFSRRRGSPGGSPSDSKTGREFDSLDVRKAMNESMQGKLEDSIFDADQPAPGQKTGGLQEAREGGAVGEPAPPPGPSPFGDPGESLPATATELATDPSPRARVRLQRKLVAQMVRRGSTPATREERIARTERQMTFQSPWMATSVKKLGMLARQISGKTVDDALVQMKFSKKKFAREVSYRLREARDVANVKHGMGLGAVPTLAAEADEGDEAAATTITTTTAKTPTKNAKKEKQDRGRYIQTREGKWITVKDPTRIYIDEVWVNRGPFRPKRYDMKGRGRFGVIRPPSTSISFRLKEEKTRIRIHDEKKVKERQRAPWVHLPDRPVHGQRPYYSW